MKKNDVINQSSKPCEQQQMLVVCIVIECFDGAPYNARIVVSTVLHAKECRYS